MNNQMEGTVAVLMNKLANVCLLNEKLYQILSFIIYVPGRVFNSVGQELFIMSGTGIFSGVTGRPETTCP